MYDRLLFKVSGTMALSLLLILFGLIIFRGTFQGWLLWSWFLSSFILGVIITNILLRLIDLADNDKNSIRNPEVHKKLKSFFGLD